MITLAMASAAVDTRVEELLAEEEEKQASPTPRAEPLVLPMRRLAWTVAILLVILVLCGLLVFAAYVSWQRDTNGSMTSPLGLVVSVLVLAAVIGLIMYYVLSRESKEL